MRNRVGCLLARIWIVFWICSNVSAEEPPIATASSKFEFSEAAAKYTLQVPGSNKHLDHLQIDLLKWSNPIRATVAGSVFLWTQNGIPQAACCMYAYRSDPGFAVDHELVSLTTAGIEAQFAGQSVWRTEKPGITWLPVPNAPTPATNRPGRLIQMRKIATSFAGHLGTPTTKRQELRLLRQPIYRFPDAPDADGAVFAFVEATDPEVLFLVRTNMQAQQPTWEFAAARMTIVHTFLTHEDNVVWSVPWWDKSRDTTYITRTRVPFSVAKE